MKPAAELCRRGSRSLSHRRGREKNLLARSIAQSIAQSID